MTRLAVLVALWLAVLGAGGADADIILRVNAVTDRGHIALFAISPAPKADVTIYERIDGELLELSHPATVYVPDSKFGPIYYAEDRDVAQWSCDRRVRKLVAVGQDMDGNAESAEFSVRTPSCVNRLALTVRRRSVSVSDTWGLGGIVAHVCDPRRCVNIVLAPGEVRARRRLALRRGDEVTLYGPQQEVTQVVGRKVHGGPVVLVTGDSMMQSLDSVLEDRLARRAGVVSDVRPGSALSSPETLDWLALARRQVRELHPHAAIVFLGMNDSYPLTADDGRAVPCCGTDWARLYAKRARAVMRVYAQGGAGHVLWLSVPIARDERRTPAIIAVDGALRRAAASVPGAVIIPLDELFTPGGRYRDTVEYRGRERRLREPDGAHLTPAGARIAADVVIALLKKLALL